MRRLGLLLAVWVSGCAAGGAAAGAVGNAVINTAIAVGASAVSRSQGDCYASCTNGTTCNHATGLCDPLPCHGLCAGNESCDQSGAVERCVPEVSSDLRTEPPVLLPARERVTPR